MGRKTILSLFDYTGTWPLPYKKHGYEVLYHDIKNGWDVIEDFPYGWRVNSVHGILAAPPCTDFAASGAVHWPKKDAPGSQNCYCCDSSTEHSITLVRAVLALVDFLNPKFWALENPVGRLKRLCPELGEPKLIFQPYEYGGYLLPPGDNYTKRTCVWGNFNVPEKRPVEVQKVPTGHHSIDHYHSNLIRSKGRKTVRSITPQGFARAFFEFNP